jgi:hypothetical protein
MKGSNMNKPFKLALTTCASLTALIAFASPAQAGEFRVYNGTTLTIVPYFKSNCWGPVVPPNTRGYVDFGGILPGTSFPWDFADPLLTDPACHNPKITFTYGFFHGQVPTKPAAWLKTGFKPGDVTSVVVGGAIVGPPDTDNDD